MRPAVTRTQASAADRVRASYARIEELDRPEVWIHLAPIDASVAAAEAVDGAVAAGDVMPLAGMVIAVKDNIDVAGMPTTAACPAFSYVPVSSAAAVKRLVDAGAIVIGKTNLDQFATGLVGTRSPYGAVRNAVDPRWISGGSSSGSAVAVALGIVDAALGTDTAGSGRVPAALNGVVGLKPTRGLVSGAGVVPACRSLDCVSVFAGSVHAAWAVASAMERYDAADPWSRAAPSAPVPFSSTVRVGVGCVAALDLDDAFAASYTAFIESLHARSDVAVVEVDVTVILQTGDLLYGGAFVAERYAAVGAFADAHPDSIDPSVRAILDAAKAMPAHLYAADIHRLAALRRQVELAIDGIDVLVLPAAPTVFTIAELAEEPLARNAAFGRLNNFCNLLDFCALTIPAGATSDGVPFGVNLFGRAFTDASLASVAAMLASEPQLLLAAGSLVKLAVVGAHLSGQPLNHQLTSRAARMVSTTRTAASYRLHALSTTTPKPGLARVVDGSGASIEVEVWELTEAAFGSFVAEIPAPLGIGELELADGSKVRGFICEPFALEGSPDITEFGGWRAYRASLNA